MMEKDTCIHFKRPNKCHGGFNCSFIKKAPNGLTCTVNGKCGDVNDRRRRDKILNYEVM